MARRTTRSGKTVVRSEAKTPPSADVAAIAANANTGTPTSASPTLPCTATGKVLTKQRKRELLYEFAHSEDLTISERIKAIETDNRLSGDLEPERHEIGLSDALLEILRGDGGRDHDDD